MFVRPPPSISLNADWISLHDVNPFVNGSPTWKARSPFCTLTHWVNEVVPATLEMANCKSSTPMSVLRDPAVYRSRAGTPRFVLPASFK
ncbi:MAG: hypothetical protein GYA24_21345 [Candidatus Lokiarchaeota archaeon]|nr:hypothetical protein [Candidatus Lokiarchaeota archaeon]